MVFIQNEYKGIDDVLKKKFGIIDIDAAYLNIDYSKKTEFIGAYGETVGYTRPYSELLRFAEQVITEPLP